MPAFPKPSRYEDHAYLQHVRAQRCVVCHNLNPDAHHLVTRGAGGSDHTAVPLCRNHHQECHHVGRARFEKRYGVHLWAVCAATLSSYIKRIGGESCE